MVWYYQSGFRGVQRQNKDRALTRGAKLSMDQMLVQTQSRLPLELFAAILGRAEVLSKHFFATAGFWFWGLLVLSAEFFPDSIDFGFDGCDLSEVFGELG